MERRQDRRKGREEGESGNSRAMIKLVFLPPQTHIILKNPFRIEKHVVSVKRVKTADQTFEFHSRFQFHDVL